ncbi:MAG: NifU family protein [Planctomycetes bacterium]|nr:NifU family protein [Planctomycetota bacterium]
MPPGKLSAGLINGLRRQGCGGGGDTTNCLIRAGGVCGNCPSSIMTIVMGIEEELRRRVPEVKYIEAVP